MTSARHRIKRKRRAGVAFYFVQTSRLFGLPLTWETVFWSPSPKDARQVLGYLLQPGSRESRPRRRQRHNSAPPSRPGLDEMSMTIARSAKPSACLPPTDETGGGSNYRKDI